MGQTFTRQQLYELVWTQPRTAIAKQLGVSDVWIGKQCRQAHVPTPPPGYWARQRHGKIVRRLNLPIRLPGHTYVVAIGDATSASRWVSHEDSDEPILPPTFDEDIDQQVDAACCLIGKVSACSDLSSPHASLAGLLTSEAKRRVKSAASRWSFEQPHFDTPLHQRQLRIFNALSHAFSRASTTLDVYAHHEQVHGRGTIHQLRLRMAFGGCYLDLYFLEPTNNPRSTGAKASTVTTMRVGQEYGGLDHEQWADRTNARLEQQLGDITKALLYRAEKTLRRHAQRQYEWRLERRQDYLEELEAQRRNEEQRRQAALEARRKQIRDDIISLAKSGRAAQDIRAMVSSLGNHPDLGHGRSDTFEAWRVEALALADRLDPMKRPLAELLLNFSLRDVPGDEKQ